MQREDFFCQDKGFYQRSFKRMGDKIRRSTKEREADIERELFCQDKEIYQRSDRQMLREGFSLSG